MIKIIGHKLFQNLFKNVCHGRNTNLFMAQKKNDLLIVLNTWYQKKQNRITVAKVNRHIKTLNG